MLIEEVKVNNLKKYCIFAAMNRTGTYTKILAVALLFVLFSTNIVWATYSGTVDEHANANKFSLKNLAKMQKTYTLSTLRLDNGYSFKSSEELSRQKTTNGVEVQSMIRLEKGNTTYVYPYKYKVQVPKFKTPTPPSYR
jgi:hypothetical protein